MSDKGLLVSNVWEDSLGMREKDKQKPHERIDQTEDTPIVREKGGLEPKRFKMKLMKRLYDKMDGFFEELV